MAKVSFTTGDGEPQSFRLLSHRPVRIGRDPSNDVILRDAKVSRSHAEIVFERGFFVLHDLASANGSFVNGVRVRVAPLTDGAELKLGNSYGFFTEELPDSPSATIARPLDDALSAPPPAPPPAPQPPPAAAPRPDEDEVGTAEHPKGPMTFAGRTQLDAGMAAIPISDAPMPEGSAIPTAAEDVIVDAVSAGDRLSVRRADGSPLFHFRRPAMLPNLAANILAGIVFVTGIAVGSFLSVERIFLPALLAAALGVVFTLLIVALAPRRVLTLYADEAMINRALTLRQDRALPLPNIRFYVQGSGSEEIAMLERNRIAPLRRRKWRLLRHGAVGIGVARERSLAAVFLRLLTLNFAGAFRPQYDVDVDGLQIASIDRSPEGMRLHYAGAMPTDLDARALIALAVVVSVLDA